MYVLSQLNLTLKKGVDAHKGKVFINKATVGNGVENTIEGMKALGAALAGAKLDTRTIYLVGRGDTPIPEVVEGMEAGKVFAYQYHKEGYAQPKWSVSLGFIDDVEAKNAGYAAKASGAKKKATPKKAQTKVGLIS